jgi:Protein of unknown function (DUF4242)
VPRYVIERELPGLGDLSDEQLQGISQKSCGVINVLGPQLQWVQSFVTADRLYCVYISPNEELIREHARQGGFPATRVSEVRTVIDPTTAERSPARPMPR